MITAQIVLDAIHEARASVAFATDHLLWCAERDRRREEELLEMSQLRRVEGVEVARVPVNKPAWWED